MPAAHCDNAINSVCDNTVAEVRGAFIRDYLTIFMLIHPLDVIKQWQAGN